MNRKDLTGAYSDMRSPLEVGGSSAWHKDGYLAQSLLSGITVSLMKAKMQHSPYATSGTALAIPLCDRKLEQAKDLPCTPAARPNHACSVCVTTYRGICAGHVVQGEKGDPCIVLLHRSKEINAHCLMSVLGHVKGQR